MNAEVRPIRTAAETALAEAFAVADAVLPEADATRVARRRAFDMLTEHGLPHRRIEAWKYTDLRAHLRFVAQGAVAPDEETIAEARALLPFAAVDANLLVIVNGFVVPKLSSPVFDEGIWVTRLAEAIEDGKLALADFQDGDFIRAFNTAFVSDGLAIRVEPGTKPERPIHVASLQVGGEPNLSHARVTLSVGEGAEVTLIDSQRGDLEAHQATTVIDLDVGRDATLTHVRLQDLGRDWVNLSSIRAFLHDAARLETIAFSIGSALARQEFAVDVAGAKAAFDFRNAAMAGGRRHIDTTLSVDHHGHGGEGRELFKAVLDGEARAVFQGKIVVHPPAQKTDSKMMAKALMLAEGPEADLKPELEIYADDVVCGHGATAGAIDEGLLFYLRSRGIPEAEAEALMVQAFLGEVMETVEHEEIREELNERARIWLEGRIVR